MRSKKRNPFVKVGILCLVLVLGLGSMGIGYAMWSDTLTIGGTVGTGTWDLGGTPGFWKNWSNHYTSTEVEVFLSDVDGSSAWLGPTTVAGMVASLEAGEASGATMEEKFLRAYLATRLDVASGRLNGATVHDVTSISGYSYLGLATPASATLSEIIAKIESKFSTSPTDPEFLIMKDVCDALNNLLI